MRKQLIAAFAAGSALCTLAVTGARAADWSMATPYGDTVFHTQNIRQFADDVKAATKGDLNINVYSGGSLIKHPSIKESVQDGVVQAGEVLMSLLENEDPIYGVDAVPFLATSYDDAAKLWKASRPVIEKKLADDGLKLLFAVPWQPQGLYTKMPVTKAEDLAGKKFRTYNAASARLAQLLKAVPAQIETPDIPQAFATGLVDAMVTSPATGVSSQAWDFVKNYTDVQAWVPKNMVFVSQEAFDALSADDQKAVLEAAAKAEERGWKTSEESKGTLTQQLADHGIAVAEPSDALKASLAAIGKTMTSEWLAKAGDAGKQVIDAYSK
jgi:TRAP-type C4-dicarboxylate transport system substrate-binding protein